LQRRTRERRALAILRRQLGSEVIEIEDCRRLSGVALTTRLAEQIERREADNANESRV
jgi:hypothetical protein